MKTKLLSLMLAGCSLLSAHAGGLKVTVQPEQDKVLLKDGKDIVIKIDITADKSRPTKRLPINLVVVLDRSGSMAGAKIERARQAALGILDQLQKGDVFGLVAYDTDVDVLIPSQEIENKKHLKDRINRLRAGGSTALYAGVEEGASELRKNLRHNYINRVILLSDGLANIGPSSPRDIAHLGRRLARRGISVTTIGVGDDYNEDLMTALAEASDANYYYVKDTEKLPEIFEKELGKLLTVTARNVQVIIECPDFVKPVGFIGRPETFSDRRATVQFSPFSSGQNRYLYLKCRVDETAEIGKALDIVKVKVDYEELETGETRAVNSNASVVMTDNEAVARASINKDVVVGKELQLSAVARDEALELADRGEYALAQKVIARRNAEMQSTNAAVFGAADSSPLASASEALESEEEQLTETKYDRATRKEIQNRSYILRNAK